MRTKTQKVDIITIVVLLLIAAAVLLSFTLPANEPEVGTADSSQTGRPLTYSDYNGKIIGIASGTNLEAVSLEQFPDSQYLYFSGYPDLSIALAEGKIDGFLMDEPSARMLHLKQPGIDYIKDRISDNQYCFAFRKNDAASAELRDRLNAFLAKCRSDGTLAEIDAIWFGTDEDKKVVDMSGLGGKNGTISVITTSADDPFSYIKDGKNVGYDIDVTVRFCREYGYDLRIGDVDFQARIPALASGQYDFTTSMNVTPEREEAVAFSDPVSEGGIVLAVRAADIAPVADGLHDISYYADKTIGVITGTLFETFVNEHYPEAEMEFFNSLPDMVQALKAGKIDTFLLGKDSAEPLMSEVSGITCLPEPVGTFDAGIVFPKTPEADKVRAQMDEYITRIKADGTLDSILEFWKSDKGSTSVVDMSGLTGENGTLRCATASDEVPSSFIVDGRFAGSDPDIVVRFCREYGYDVELITTDFSGVLPGLVAGIYDIAANEVVITEERKESVNFSVPYIRGPVVMIVNAEADADSTSAAETTDNNGFLESTADSFVKNFIREERWKLILKGIATTCLITVLSAISGTVLAFLICMFRRTGSRLANAVSDIYVKLMQGTPMVVLLMILYYVIFGKTGLEAVWVAVIGFSLNFGAYAAEIMRSGIGSVDDGQREAALALGYSENQAFFRFIFPQAAMRFLPVYSQEIVSLLKSTSIVGYIAIQDLTKMSDIIRSRTYEAFFPLIVTAMIYFILAWIISLILKIILKIVSPKRKRGTENQRDKNRTSPQSEHC